MLLRNLSDNLWPGTVERSNLPALHAIQHFSLTLESLDVTSLSWNWNFTRDTISRGFSEGPPGGLWGVVISCGRSELEKIIVAETTELLQDKLYGELRWAFSIGQPKAGGRLLRGGNYRQQKACWGGSKSSYFNIKCDSFCRHKLVMPGCVPCVYRYVWLCSIFFSHIFIQYAVSLHACFPSFSCSIVFDSLRPHGL